MLMFCTENISKLPATEFRSSRINAITPHKNNECFELSSKMYALQ